MFAVRSSKGRAIKKNSTEKNDFPEMNTSAFSGGVGLRDSAGVWLERNWCRWAYAVLLIVPISDSPSICA